MSTYITDCENENGKYDTNLIKYIEERTLNEELANTLIDKIFIHKESDIEIIWQDENAEFDKK